MQRQLRPCSPQLGETRGQPQDQEFQSDTVRTGVSCAVGPKGHREVSSPVVVMGNQEMLPGRSSIGALKDVEDEGVFGGQEPQRRQLFS